MPLFQQADIVLLPLLDGSYGVAQVENCDGLAATLLLTLRRGAPDAAIAPLAANDILARVTVNTETLNTGQWPVVGFEMLPVADGSDPEPTDPAVIEAFLNACHGLYPYDAFGTAFFDEMLLDAEDTRPRRLGRSQIDG